jgi:hypothetical protein
MQKPFFLSRPRLALLLCSLFALAPLCAIAAPKPAKPKPPPPAPVEPPAAPVPADLNDLSLRVTALETLYDLDLSPEQLRILHGLAAQTAQTGQRTAPTGTPKLTAALKDLHEALLKADDAKIDELKDSVDDLKDEDEVDLDDDVAITDAARAKTPDFLRHIKASQIAAYFVQHSDELTDPVEQMMDTLDDIRMPDAPDADDSVQETAEDVGHLVAGLDGARSKEVTDAVTAWFKTARAIKDEDYTARRPILEENAKKIVGEIPPMTILTHWMETEIATLLSNPQLAGAVDATLTAKAKAK